VQYVDGLSVEVLYDAVDAARTAERQPEHQWSAPRTSTCSGATTHRQPTLSASLLPPIVRSIPGVLS
jgi:hypothetical protein